MVQTALGFELFLANCYGDIFDNPRKVEAEPGLFVFQVYDGRLVVGNLKSQLVLLMLAGFPLATDQRKVWAELGASRIARLASPMAKISAAGSLVIVDRRMVVTNWVSHALANVTPVKDRPAIEAALLAGFRQLDRVD